MRRPIEEVDEERSYCPLEYTTDFTRQDIQNLRANTAARLTGKPLRVSFHDTEHLNKGKLKETIFESPRFYNNPQASILTRLVVMRESPVREPPTVDASDFHTAPNRSHNTAPINIEGSYIFHQSRDRSRASTMTSPSSFWGPPGRGPPGGGPSDDGSPIGNGPPGGFPPRGPPGGDDPPGGGPPRGPAGGGPPDPNDPFGGLPNLANQQPVRPLVVDPYHFDRKMKVTDILEWHGDDDSLLDWLDKVNLLAKRSVQIYNELGFVVPQRLLGRAATWFHTLPQAHKNYAQTNWTHFKTALTTHFMNQTWTDRMKLKALRVRYHQKSNELETPSDYFHRKLRLMRLLFEFNDSELIMEIMNGAPKFWTTIIDTSRVTTIADLQYIIKYHEESLISDPFGHNHNLD